MHCKVKVYEKAFFLLILATGLVSANAQVRTTGQISGTVTDPSGALLAGAMITVTMPSTGLTQSVKANAEGQYSFPELQPGVYQVTATAGGFAATTYTDVVIEAARTKDLPIRMKVGQINEKIEVSAQGEILETTTNTLATTIDPDAVQDLPLAGRDILPLAELVSGAQSGGDERFTTYNSLPNGSISITIDGMTANSQRYRTSTTGFFTFAPLRLGAFDEMTVSTTDLTADAGAEGSTQAQFVTKHGTNSFHGNAFWEARNSFFNANTYTNNALGLPRAFEVLNDWGGSVGGPLWKNKVFFFVNFEGINQKFPSPTTTYFPTAQAQQGNFTYIGTDGNQHTVNLFTLAGQNGFPTTPNTLIGSMLSQISGYATQGAVSPVSGLPYEQSVSFTGIAPDKERYPTVRLDFQLTPKVSLHSSFDMWWRDIGNEYVNYPGDSVEANGFKSTYYVQSNGVDWIITPNLINQANFGIQSDVELFNPGNGFNEFQGQNNFVINTPTLVNVGAPLFAPVIPSFVLPLPRNNPVWSLFDNLNWTHGKHTFTFGGDLRIANSHELEINNPPTIYTGLSTADPAQGMFVPSNFPSINTSPQSNNQDLANAAALYATLTGRINYIYGSSWVDTTTHQYQVLGKATNWEGQTVGGIYFQDKWRATAHLALNYGFRWQMSGAVHNTDGLWTGPTLSDLYSPSGTLFQPGVLSGNPNPQINLRPNPYNADLKEPNPNIGFAWNPTFSNGFLEKLAGGDKMVIRGGFAISHYDEGWVPIEGVTLFGNPGGTQSEFLFPGAGGFAPGSLAIGSPITLDTFPTSFTFPQPMSEFFPGESFATINPAIRTPYVESWNFGIQRKIPGNNVFEINYVGNHAVHMWMASDLNETNIFENGFLTEFQHAQQNLAACEAVPSCNAPASGLGPSFANQGLAGQVPLPIFTAAFGGTGAAAGASNQSASFQGPPFVPLLQEGQAGAAANQLATAAGATFLCNLVGTNLSSCSSLGLTGAGNYPSNFFQLNPFAAGGTITELTDPGSSSYNGLQAQLKHQTGYGLFLNANYTYSHALTNRYLGDYDTADYALVNYVTLRDPRLSRGPTPYDQRHTFRTFLTYQLPFGKGKSYRTGNSVADQIIGGWTVGSIVTVSSGRNFKLQSGYNTFNYSNAYWPDASDSGVVLNGTSVHQLQSKIGLYPGPTPAEPKVFFPPSLLSASGTSNPSVLAAPTTPGQLADFVYLVGPKFFNTDISIVKSIPIAERVKFNIYAEFLNAFNHTNWNVIDGYSYGVNNPAEYANINSTTFPALSDPYIPRNIQFRLQLAF